MDNHLKPSSKNSTILILLATGIFIIFSALFISWGKNNTDEYNKRLDKYWIEMTKYCESKGKKLVKHKHTRRGSKGSSVSYTGSCGKK